MAGLHPFTTRAAPGQAHLRIMATTDLHVHVYSWDYYADRPCETVGLARTAALARAARAEAANAVFVDNGDFLQGNPLGDFIAYERGLEDGAPHPVIAAMNAAGIEAATIGNHEFNYGLDFLTGALAGAAFPVVSANLVTRRGADPRADRLLVPPYAILDRQITDGAGRHHALKIGVIGLAPPQVTVWDRHHLDGRLTARDMVEAAAAWVPQMREAGAEIVVALAHCGIGEAEHREGMEHAAIPLARLPGIDAIVLGHSHLVFPGPGFDATGAVDPVAGTICGKPAVMPGFWGSHLGVIDLMLERGAGGWRVIAQGAAARPIASGPPGSHAGPPADTVAEVLDAARDDHEAALAYVRRAVGRTRVPLHSYFALVGDDPSVRIVAEAQRDYVARMLAGTEHAGLPVLSSAAPFKTGGRGGPENYTDVAAGPLAIRNVADLYIYPNKIRAVRVTGAELRDWLERAAGVFRRVEPGRADQPLIAPEFASYNFDVIAGVSYEIDLSQPAKFGPAGELADPAAHRITALTHAGRPVADDDVFAVATNSYRAGGGGNFPGTGTEAVILEGPDTNRDVLLRYVSERDEVDAPGPPAWRFRPLPGTSVLFETGPRGAGHAGRLGGLAIEPLGETLEGFLRFRINL